MLLYCVEYVPDRDEQGNLSSSQRPPPDQKPRTEPVLLDSNGQDGTTHFIDQDTEQLAKSPRPLSQATKKASIPEGKRISTSSNDAEISRNLGLVASATASVQADSAFRVETSRGGGAESALFENAEELKEDSTGLVQSLGTHTCQREQQGSFDSSLHLPTKFGVGTDAVKIVSKQTLRTQRPLHVSLSTGDDSVKDKSRQSFKNGEMVRSTAVARSSELVAPGDYLVPKRDRIDHSAAVGDGDSLLGRQAKKKRKRRKKGSAATHTATEDRAVESSPLQVTASDNSHLADYNPKRELPETEFVGWSCHQESKEESVHSDSTVTDVRAAYEDRDSHRHECSRESVDLDATDILKQAEEASEMPVLPETPVSPNLAFPPSQAKYTFPSPLRRASSCHCKLTLS